MGWFYAKSVGNDMLFQHILPEDTGNTDDTDKPQVQVNNG